MRIKYSVIIPVVFVSFCGVFVILLYVTERAKQQQEEESRQAQKVFAFITEEHKAARKILHKIQDNLNRQQLEMALSLCPELKDCIQNMYEFAKQMPTEDLQKKLTDNIGVVEVEVVKLQDVLSKGNIEEATKVIRILLRSK